jgi:HSP20 family protein
MAIEQRRSLRDKLTSEPTESRPSPRAVTRRADWPDRNWRADPFSMMGRLAEQMDRWFLGRPNTPWKPGGSDAWIPQVESFQRGNQFVVRADLPGLKREDVTVEIADDALTIEGERRDEHQEEREGVFTSERSYGNFCRVVPLPEGAIADSAKASFLNGVLEVTVDAPPREVSRGRKVEISS